MIKAINRSIAARHEEDEKGFTLIELLVVILIIGVLAAIAIPAFLNQRQGAWESQVESDIRNAVIAAESYAVGNNGSYDGLITGTDAGAAELDANGFNETPEVTIEVATATATGFTLTGEHDSVDDKTWTYDSEDGSIVEVPVP